MGRARRGDKAEQVREGMGGRAGEGGRGRERERSRSLRPPSSPQAAVAQALPHGPSETGALPHSTHRGCCLFAACQVQVQGHTGAPPVSGSRPPRLCPVGRRSRGKTTLRPTCPNTGSNGTAVSQGLLPVARNTGGSVAASSFACRIAAISVSTLGDGAGRAYPARGAELGTPPRQGGKGTEKGIPPRLGARSWGYLPGWGNRTSPSMSSAILVVHRFNSLFATADGVC